MRLVLLVLIMLVAADDAMADTSREDKLAYIIETADFRGQIIVYQEEVAKRSIDELSANPGVKLDEKAKEIIAGEMAAVFQEIIEDYIKEIINVHTEYLTDQEINPLYNFYRSPEGTSLGAKLAAINGKIFWIDARYLELISKRSVSRIAERLSQEGHN